MVQKCIMGAASSETEVKAPYYILKTGQAWKTFARPSTNHIRVVAQIADELWEDSEQEYAVDLSNIGTSQGSFTTVGQCRTANINMYANSTTVGISTSIAVNGIVEVYLDE